MDQTILDVTYEKISASLGSLLLLWAAIERSAREEVIRAHGCLPKSAYGIAAVLREWESTTIAVQPAVALRALLASTLRAQLQEPLDIRNGICHGLIGISSAQKERPATLKWEINGENHSITWNDLQASFRWLSKVPFAISMISNSSSERLGSRLMDSSENRQWWLTEFGLDLLKPNLGAF